VLKVCCTLRKAVLVFVFAINQKMLELMKN